MSKPLILQLSAMPEWDEAPLRAGYEVVALHQVEDRAATLAARGPQVRAIVTNGGLGLPADVLTACTAAEIVAIYGVGYDAVDLNACKARGLRVTNTPDVLTEDCADLAVGMLIALSRGIVKAEAHARGPWKTSTFPLQRRVSGMKVGILGLGRIGTAVAERLKGFGCDIAYAARAPRDNGLTYLPDPVALAARSDALIVTTLSSPETRHVVDARVLKALGPQGLLVNISRAVCIDETALIHALAEGTIAGAALDVFENEPFLDQRFLLMSNVLLQPHHASGTVETRKAMGALMRENLAAHFAGRPLPTPVV